MVYSNQPEVELFVNGHSYGKKQRNIKDYPAQGFHWNVKLRKGTNTIRAISANLSDEITCEYQTEKWGTPAQITLSYADGLVTALVCDEKGVPCLDSKEWLEFSMIGDGKIVQNQGTVTGSRRIQAANGKATVRVEGKGRSVVVAKVICDSKTTCFGVKELWF